MNSKTYNLVLSGGGVRGYAHVGVIKALQELGLKMGAISGGSSGALIGAMLCDGYSTEEIWRIVSSESPRVGVDFRKLRDGLLSFGGVEALLRRYLRSHTFSQLKLPLYVSATDLNTGRQKVFSDGELIPALAASSALPLLLPPVIVDGIPYGDAGMSNNLPAEPFIGKDERIIGVHVNPLIPFKRKAGLVETIDRSMHIIVGNTTRPSMSLCHIFIEPPELVKYHILERKKSKEIMQCGYDYVMRDKDLRQRIDRYEAG